MSEVLSRRAWDVLVTRDGEYVYKQQPLHLCDNEMYALIIMRDSGYVPFATRESEVLICMEYIKSEFVTNVKEFLGHYHGILDALTNAYMRHGDITKPHLLVRNNRPLLIDWAESRALGDPRPDKRRQGDSYWLSKTMAEKVGMSESEFFAAVY